MKTLMEIASADKDNIIYIDETKDIFITFVNTTKNGCCGHLVKRLRENITGDANEICWRIDADGCLYCDSDDIYPDEMDIIINHYNTVNSQWGLSESNDRRLIRISLKECTVEGVEYDTDSAVDFIFSAMLNSTTLEPRYSDVAMWFEQYLKSDARTWVGSCLIDIYTKIGIDTPTNHDEILDYCFEDAHDTTGGDPSDSDVAISFRRFLENV